jgi:hypothetical protein
MPSSVAPQQFDQVTWSVTDGEDVASVGIRGQDGLQLDRQGQGLKR